MTNTRFFFHEHLAQAQELRTRLEHVLRNSADEKVRKLAETLPSFDIVEEIHGDEKNLPPLTVAFVGQYNAGKSTIIKALTGLENIPIDANVCTDKVTAYDWNGIRLLDTPGIHAGYPEHDEKTYSAIDRADLLVFVVTSELFDDVIGRHFRNLCFERNKASEILLVVNKMAMDPGTPDDKLPDIERVTRPKTPADFRVTFIDAQSYLEAMEEENEEDRAELEELSNFGAFVEALNAFIQDKGLMGRVTTPLFELKAIAEQAKAFLSVDMPEERAAIELLNRAHSLFLASRSRLRGAMARLINTAVSDLIFRGDALAESVGPGSTEEFINIKLKCERDIQQVQEKLMEDAKSVVEIEFSELRKELEMLEDSVLAKELRSRVSTALMKIERGVTETEMVYAEQGQDYVVPVQSDIHTRLEKVGRVTSSLGKSLVEWTTGPAKGAKIGTAAAARGSKAHEAIYKVGKLIGMKFKPWGAVRIAKNIGRIGSILKLAGPVVDVVSQITEDISADKQKTQLREARHSIRAAYRDWAKEIERDFWQKFDEFCKDHYDKVLAQLDSKLSELVGGRTSRSEEAQAINQVISEVTDVIKRIQGEVYH